MSEMKHLVNSVVDAYQNGMTFDAIAQAFGVSYDMVAQIVETAIEDDPSFFDDADVDPAEYDYQYDDSMDGDDASALASAGWGTDEDYGAHEVEIYEYNEF
jgi:hypothetical protein